MKALVSEFVEVDLQLGLVVDGVEGTQAATQPNSLVLTSRQQEARQRPSLELTTPSTFSAPGSCLLKPSLTGLCPCTQSQLCSLHME